MGKTLGQPMRLFLFMEETGLDFSLKPLQQSEIVTALHLLMQEVVALRNFLSVRVADNPNIFEWEQSNINYVRNKYFTIKGHIDILMCFQVTAVHMPNIEKALVVISDKFNNIW